MNEVQVVLIFWYLAVALGFTQYWFWVDSDCKESFDAYHSFVGFLQTLVMCLIVSIVSFAIGPVCMLYYFWRYIFRGTTNKVGF